MVSLTIEQWTTIFIGIASFVPTFVLFKQYLKTRLVDFLLFSGIFLSVSIAAFAIIMAAKTNNLFFYQLNFGALSFTALFFFHHSIRIRWVKPPKLIWTIGNIWFLVLIIVIFFWELETQESNAFVLFMEMPYNYNIFHPKGAGLVLNNDIVIFSSSFRFLWNTYLIFATGMLFYSYLKITPVVKSERTNLTKRVWIIIWGLIFLFSIIDLPWFSQQTTLVILNIVILIAEGLAASLAIFVPESMLISHPQLLRAYELYERVQLFDSETDRVNFGMSSLVEYLANIPSEWLEMIDTEY